MLLEQVLIITLNDILKEKKLFLPELVKEEILENANSFILNDGSFVAVAVDEALNDYLSSVKKTQKLDAAIGVYAVKNKNDNGIRYFAIGIKDDAGKFTGIIHDYLGNGDYGEGLVYKDTFFPSAAEDAESGSWDDQVALFDKISPHSLERLKNNLFSFASYDTEAFNYVIDDPTSFENGVLIHNTNLITPYGLGNTSFVDGYEIFDYEGSFEDFKEKCCTEKTDAIAEFNAQNIETIQKITLG